MLNETSLRSKEIQSSALIKRTRFTRAYTAKKSQAAPPVTTPLP